MLLLEGQVAMAKEDKAFIPYQMQQKKPSLIRFQEVG